MYTLDRCHGASCVAVRWFDLHYICSEGGEQPPTGGDGKVLSELHHSDAGEHSRCWLGLLVARLARVDHFAPSPADHIGNTGPVRIVRDDLTSPQVIELLAVHLAGMRATSPACSVHALELDALRAPEVHFFAAWDADDLLGMGAIKLIGPDHGEVKSMRTNERHLGRGVGAAILTRLLDEARQLGLSRVSLETGTGEPFDAAHALYRRFGFQETGPFGDYTFDPFSAYYTLEL
jgi:putative acetyltransferase